MSVIVVKSYILDANYLLLSNVHKVKEKGQRYKVRKQAAVPEEAAIAGENLSHTSCGATSGASRWPRITANLVEMHIAEVESTWTALPCKMRRSPSCGPTLSTTTTAEKMSSMQCNEGVRNIQ